MYLTGVQQDGSTLFILFLSHLVFHKKKETRKNSSPCGMLLYIYLVRMFKYVCVV